MVKRQKQNNMQNMSANTNQVVITIKRHNDNNGGHYHVILEDFDDKYVSVGLTTKPKKGKNSTNYTLENDPLGKNNKSYMRRQGTVSSKNNYVEPRKGNMTTKDYSRAKEYGEKAKVKYLAQKNKKK